MAESIVTSSAIHQFKNAYLLLWLKSHLVEQVQRYEAGFVGRALLALTVIPDPLGLGLVRICTIYRPNGTVARQASPATTYGQPPCAIFL